MHACHETIQASVLYLIRVVLARPVSLHHTPGMHAHRSCLQSSTSTASPASKLPIPPLPLPLPPPAAEIQRKRGLAPHRPQLQSPRRLRKCSKSLLTQSARGKATSRKHRCAEEPRCPHTHAETSYKASCVSTLLTTRARPSFSPPPDRGNGFRLAGNVGGGPCGRARCDLGGGRPDDLLRQHIRRRLDREGVAREGRGRQSRQLASAAVLHG